MIAAFIALLVVALALGGYILFMYLRGKRKPTLPAVVAGANDSDDVKEIEFEPETTDSKFGIMP